MKTSRYNNCNEAGVERIDSKEKLIALMNQYQNLVFSVCLKLVGDYFVAEDMTQETFISAYEHMDTFDGAAEKAWLCRIATNKCIDYKREAARRMIPTEESEMPEIASPGENEPLQEYENHEVMETFMSCCNELNEPYKSVAIQHFVNGKTAKEIALMKDIPLKTVQTHIYRAKEMLKKSYGKEMLDT